MFFFPRVLDKLAGCNEGGFAVVWSGLENSITKCFMPQRYKILRERCGVVGRRERSGRQIASAERDMGCVLHLSRKQVDECLQFTALFNV